MRCGTRVAATAGSPFTRLFICSIFYLREVGPVARGESSKINAIWVFRHTTHCKPDAVSWQSRLHSRANQDAVVERAPHHQPISHRNAE